MTSALRLRSGTELSHLLQNLQNKLDFEDLEPSETGAFLIDIRSIELYNQNIITTHDTIQNENLMDVLQRNANEKCQNENDIENLMDALQRDAHVGTSLRGRPVDKNQCFTNGQIDDHLMNTSKYGQHNKIYGASISHVMDWFKTMTTNEYKRGVKQLGWKRFNKRFWQRSFNDKIIRTKYSLIGSEIT